MRNFWIYYFLDWLTIGYLFYNCLFFCLYYNQIFCPSHCRHSSFFSKSLILFSSYLFSCFFYHLYYLCVCAFYPSSCIFFPFLISTFYPFYDYHNLKTGLSFWRHDFCYGSLCLFYLLCCAS